MQPLLAKKSIVVQGIHEILTADYGKWQHLKFAFNTSYKPLALNHGALLDLYVDIFIKQNSEKHMQRNRHLAEQIPIKRP